MGQPVDNKKLTTRRPATTRNRWSNIPVQYLPIDTTGICHRPLHEMTETLKSEIKPVMIPKKGICNTLAYEQCISFNQVAIMKLFMEMGRFSRKTYHRIITKPQG